jgi:hypothetical protein
MLAAIGVNHLARDHLEMTLVLAVPATQLAAVKPNLNRDNRVAGDIAVGFAVSVLCCCTTLSPTRSVLFRTVPAFCALLIGSSSDSSTATLPNGVSAAYRAVTQARSGAIASLPRSSAAKLFAHPGPDKGRYAAVEREPAHRQTRSRTSLGSTPCSPACAHRKRRSSGARPPRPPAPARSDPEVPP